MDAAADDAAALQAAETRRASAERAVASAERDVTVAEEIRLLREQTLQAARDRVAALQDAQNSAATTAAASTSSGASFSGLAARDKLNDASTQAIATAVDNIVTSVLSKSYVTDYCMAIISGPNTEAGQPNIGFCQSIVGKAFEEETKRLMTKFGADLHTDCISAWIKANPANGTRLDSWLKTQGTGVDRLTLIFSSNAAALRNRVVQEFAIPCS